MSRHQTEGLLPAFAAGELDLAETARVEAHLASCATCREWLETWQLLEACVLIDGCHPSSDLVARYAVEPSEVDEIDAGILGEHLESCPGCSTDLRLARAALAAAKSERPNRTWPNRLGAALHLDRPGRRLAAALALAVVGLAALGLYLGGTARPGRVEISERSFEGREVVEAPDALLATTTHVGSNSDVIFRAGGLVALGEGFQVADGATFTIEVKRESLK